MRYLVLSDIHGNLEALDAVLQEGSARGYDAVLVLGDLVGYGADPNAVIERVRSLQPAAVIRGNHDKVAAGVEDADHNVTRFLIMASHPEDADNGNGPVVTSFIFKVRNVPAALYKALGGFATNGVNMVKLESYVDAGFNQAQFYAEVVGHPEQGPVKNAFEELAFFSHEVERLGVYPAHPFRFRSLQPERSPTDAHGRMDQARNG